VTRVAREVDTEGWLGGQAEMIGRVRHVVAANRERQRPRGQPSHPGAAPRGGELHRALCEPLASENRCILGVESRPRRAPEPYQVERPVATPVIHLGTKSVAVCEDLDTGRTLGV
jgi:hypothetical protein